jgi:glycosyltransferase involved in cell wall biosynthesis
VVGCIGRSEPDKGTREAIAAYRAFVRQHPGPHRLRMATFGVPPAWLEGIPGLEPVVPGNDRELADYYRSLDVLLALCTIQHGAHHYPVLEAMASDLGVVTTGYTPADSGNAWIVGADPEEAAAALAAILADPERTREKLGNAQTAILAYDWPRVASRFLTFLASVCGKQGGVP